MALIANHFSAFFGFLTRAPVAVGRKGRIAEYLSGRTQGPFGAPHLFRSCLRANA